MYTYKLTEIVFNNGEKIQPENLTVIIGPNNVGKSRALKDIAQQVTSTSPLPSVVVSDVKWTTPQSFKELQEAYALERYQHNHSHWIFRTLFSDLSREHILNASDWLDNDNFDLSISNKHFFVENFGMAMLAYLTTEYRLQLVKEAPSSQEEMQQGNLLQALYNAGSDKETKIQELVSRVFGKSVKLDFTVPQKFLFRVGDDFSSIPPDPRDARTLMQQYEKLDDQGDGIRSFIGIITALLTINRNVILIDEPELFLHPPQAFRLGEFFAEQAINQRQIILATHSVDLLRGILSKTTDVTILRIERKDKKNDFNILDPNRLQEVIKDPLLSSARVLDGLFYSGVVVVEADSDGRFYHIVSNKVKNKNNIDLCFVNADNKQTVPKILSLYRDMGVSCAGIVDFDVLNNETEFKKQLEYLKLDRENISSLLSIRKRISEVSREAPLDSKLETVIDEMKKLVSDYERVKDKKLSPDKESINQKKKLLSEAERIAREIVDLKKEWKTLKEKGREALPSDLQLKFDELWQECSQKGLFINPRGELESMLTHVGLKYTTDKRGWITQALSFLPRLEVNDNEYPWKFIKSIQEYLVNE